MAIPHIGAGEHLTYVLPKTRLSTGQVYYRLSIFDTAAQRSRKITVASDGAIVDIDALLASDQAARERAHGHLDEDFHLAALVSPSRRYQVEILVKPANVPERPLILDENSREFFSRRLRDSVLPALSDAEALVTRAGGKVVWKAEHAPALIAEVQGAQLLRSGLMDNPIIESIAFNRTDPPVRQAAQSTTDLNLSPVFHQNNQYGSGVRVGLSGESDAHCTIANPFFLFNLTNSFTPRTCTTDADCSPCGGKCNFGRCAMSHGTMVAGMIGHDQSLIYPRGAPLVDLFMTTGTESHQQALQWFYNNAAYVENESWLGAGTNLYAQDYFSINGLAVVEAAGNSPGGSGTGYQSSCHAGNTICVGSYDSLTTFSDFTNTANPTSCSRWVTGCDRELPHVTFHGGAVVTTTNNPSDPDHLEGGSGTSFAAPAAVGLIALMHQRWHNMFWGWPEPTRAALMASADRDVHQIPHTPACPTAGKTYSDYRCPDERDGAGVPNAVRIENMMTNSRVQKYTLYRDSSFPGGTLTLAQVSLQVGQRLRAVVSWDSCPNSEGKGAHADLDLHVLNPAGSVMFAAESFDETYEIAEIVAVTAGTHTLRIQKHGWQDCPELGGTNARTYLGLAYDVR